MRFAAAPSWLVERPRQSSLRRYLGLAPALGALLGMAAWGWNRLVEIQIDFGREVYLPWQLVNGKRLYADVVYHYGPLSPYLNALAFHLFGTSIQTLMLCNLVIAAIITVVLYLILLEVADPFSATVACLVFTLVFACGNWFGHPSIFNYLCPYCHPATHGLLLGLVSVFVAMRVNRFPTWWNAAGCGFALGLTFLTKPEPFVAAGVAVLIGFGLTVWQHHLTRWRALGLLSAGLAAAGLAVLTAFAALSFLMPWQTAVLGVLGSWPYMGNQGDTVFNRAVMGLDDVQGNLLTLLGVSAWYGVLILPLALYAPGRKCRILLLVFGAGSLAVAAAWGWPSFATALRPLPLLLVAMAFGFGYRLLRSRNAAGAHTTTGKLMITVFAGMLLGRIFLRTSVFDYGFVLAAPATLVAIVAWLVWLPGWIGAPSRRLVHTGMALGALVACVLFSLARYQEMHEGQRHPIGSGGDAFFGDERCQFAASALEEIRRRVRPGETVCVLPEGVMLNYLARVDSSIPYECFLPPVLQMYGERQIINSLQAHPPDYVVLFHRDCPEYGASLFGRDYGQELYAWVKDHYSPVAEYGRSPMTEDGEGLTLMAVRTNRP
jgi:hypothetical protein